MPSSRTPRTKHHRVTKACFRCRIRKTKCDLRFPVCGGCEKARVPCLGYDAEYGCERPRSTVAYLEDRVAQLEIELARLRSEQSVDRSTVVDSAITGLTRALATVISDPSAIGQPSRQPRHSILSISSPHYLSESPAPPLPALQDESPELREENTKCSKISQIPRHVIEIMLKNYTDIYLPQSPYIEESQLHQSCEKVFTHVEGAASHFDIFTVAIALAISATTLICHDEERATVAAEEFWNTAKEQLTYIGEDQPWQRLRALLLLTHYGFVNPRAVNVWSTAGAASRLLFQLGLHQELPADQQAKADEATLDVRRKLFWATYSLDAAIHLVVGKAFAFPRDANIAKYPGSVFGQNDPVTHIWQLRVLEADISSILCESQSTPPYPWPASLDMWRKHTIQRLEAWFATTHTSGNGLPGEKIEFRELMYNTNVFRLNCPSLHFPHPTIDMRKKCLNSIIAIANIYSHNLYRGKLFYIWHAVYQLLECGVCLIETVISGVRKYAAGEPTFLTGFDGLVLTRTLETIPQLVHKISRRWPKVTSHAKFLQESSAPALECISFWSQGGCCSMPEIDPDLERTLRRLMVPLEKPLQTAVAAATAIDPFSQLIAAADAATPITAFQQFTWSGDQQVEMVTPLAGMEPVAQTPDTTSWMADQFWNRSSEGLALSVHSDDLSRDFPGIELDQIFAAFKDGQAL